VDYVTVALRNLWTLQSYAAMANGELQWSLTQSTHHDAGAVLDITVKIKNTTDAQRQYQIYFGLFDLSGPVISTWVWPDAFLIPAMSEESFILSQQINYSDCILQASLYDPETGSMGATLQTILEQSSAPIEGGFGSLSWNLLQKTAHNAGSTLSITFKIRNPSAADRQYQIYLGLFDLSGSVIATWPLPDTITVEGSSEKLVSPSVKIDYSNCILQASLCDVQTGGMGAALQTILEQPPSPIEQVAPVITAVSSIMAVGMIVSSFPEMPID